MNEEQQRIFMAELDGYMNIQRCTRRLKASATGVELMGTKDRPSLNYSRTYERLPEYDKDLNAVHRVLIRLSAIQQVAIGERIMRGWGYNSVTDVKAVAPILLSVGADVLVINICEVLKEVKV